MAVNVKVFHLELNNQHYYFGSKKALCDTFGKEQIGITYDSLRNVSMSAEKPFINKRCIIRQGILVTSSPKNNNRLSEEIDK
jgi:hypothetical protein